jgi:large subunit ribosomal protein L10
MSKYVKNLITDDLRNRLHNVNDALLVSVAGMDANRNYQFRKELRSKNIQVMVVKNSLLRRAAEGTSLAAGFNGLEGLTAIVWGADDIVALSKEITKYLKDKQYAPLESRGGVMDGAPLTAAEVEQVSKWPSREEQLSLLLGQILAPGANLVSQLTSVSGALASQIKQLGESDEGAEGSGEGGEAPAAAEAAAAEAAPSA